MDLKDFDSKASCDKGTRMPITNPKTGMPITNADGKEWALMVVGVDSDIYIKAQRSAQARRMKAAAGSRNMRLTPEDLAEEALDIAAKCVVGIENVIESKKAVEFNFTNARRLLNDYPWLREQVDGFINDRSNFLS